MFDLGQLGSDFLKNTLKSGSLRGGATGSLYDYAQQNWGQLQGSAPVGDPQSHTETPPEHQALFGLGDVPKTPTPVVQPDKPYQAEQTPVLPSDDERVKNGQQSGIWGIIKAVI